MNRYEGSIKCKYCGHFSERTNKCYLFTSFDSAHDIGNEHQYHACKATFPDSRCAYFRLDLMTNPFKNQLEEPERREDGSYIVDFRDVPWLKEQLEKERAERIRKARQGCYIATCIYGSYDCPQVWTLRRFRDEFLAHHLLGRTFIRMYYAISPEVVRVFGDTSAFRKFFKSVLDRFVSQLNNKGYENTPYNDKSW